MHTVKRKNEAENVALSFRTFHSERYADDYDKVQEKAWICHNRDIWQGHKRRKISAKKSSTLKKQ